MSNLREAAEQALEALRGYRRELGCEQPCAAEQALGDALEQSDWQGLTEEQNDAMWMKYARTQLGLEQPEQPCNCRWVGDVQTQQCTLHEAHVDAIHEWAERAKAAEAKLGQSEQEPVAWSPALSYPNYEKERVWSNGKPRLEDVEYWLKNGNGITYCYTVPPRREWQSLTEEEVLRCLKWDEAVEQITTVIRGPEEIVEAAKQEAIEKYRAIEAALKEKNNG